MPCVQAKRVSEYLVRSSPGRIPPRAVRVSARSAVQEAPGRLSAEALVGKVPCDPDLGQFRVASRVPPVRRPSYRGPAGFEFE